MTDSQPLVCIFFLLPPSDQLFMRIHDIPWLVLLPQIEKLTYAMETHLAVDFSSPAMEILIEARVVMGSKMLPLRDTILSSRDLARHYVGFVDAAFRNRRLSSFVKDVYIFTVQEVAQKIEKAQRALSEFREELGSVISRIASLVEGDNNRLSLFITESTQILSVIIPAIEECNALLQECNGGFQNIHKQNFDPESFERSPPSDAEFELVGEKWKVLLIFLHSISADWNSLEGRMANPLVNRAASDTVSPDVLDEAALARILEDPVNPEVPPERSLPGKAKIPFWRKLFQHISTCFSSLRE